MAIDISKYKDLFISEVEDQLSTLNKELLVLEKNGETPELLNTLMRVAHTMKGASSTMGFEDFSLLAHVMEDVFDGARNSKLTITSEMVTDLFGSLDKLEEYLTSIKKDTEFPDLTDQIATLKTIRGVDTKSKSKTKISGKTVKKKSNEVSTIKKPLKKKIKKAQDIDVEKVQIEEISHIKVPVSRLDNLMNLMEELVIDKMKLESIMNTITKQLETVDDMGLVNENSLTNKLKPAIEHLSRVVSDIQYEIMQARLVTVKQIFDRFPRMIRDLATKEKKKIEFIIKGENLELDRTIVDKLGEPLVHILRNAVDHGIEKNGTILLEAFREKDYALIVIEDNGSGVNFENVKRVAVERGIVDQNNIDSASEKQLLNLLFNPNLSTKDKVTTVSGRGVGLSAVRSFTDSVGGVVLVESPINDNGGTRFILKLPLTLAIINTLLVKVKNNIFAIPFSSIERSVTITKLDIKSVADQKIAIVDGEKLPLIHADRIFDLDLEDLEKDKKTEISKEENEERSDEKIVVVVIKQGNKTSGIVVDSLLEEEEIIVKPLPSVLRNTKGFSGSTILGNGSTVLIIDVASVLEDETLLEKNVI
jgi:two-component system chemotaxis sensor kinase CheA